jgi:hypothetical protein
MDEFTGIAVWILMTFLAVNAAIIWFDSSNTFQNMNLDIGVTQNDAFGQNDINSASNSYYQQDCSTATSNAVDYSLCLIGSIGDTISTVTSLPGKIIGSLWTLLTAWASLLNAILLPVPGGTLFIKILIPFFGLIEFVAIFIITMRVAGIIRGGS